MSGYTKNSATRSVAVLVLLAGLLCPAEGSSLGRGGTAGGDAGLIDLAPVVPSGLDSPVFLTHAGDGSARIFVVEQPGRIRISSRGSLLATPFLDITARVDYGGERGLLGLAFHPAYPKNRRYFVNYTRASDGATVVAEYRASGDPNHSGRKERIILIVEQPHGNHNGGMIAFGPDGHLYVGMGDGGAGGDPQNRGQNRRDLLGKMLRLDVDRGTPYAIPSDNPYAAGGGRPEIYALGFRNPWRFSFDRRTGRLWAADVGQNSWEEVDLVERGGNYGWRVMEGAHCFSPSQGCSAEGLERPVAEYANAGRRCSITGGYVYRGAAVPSLRGTYVFGDYCSGEVFGLNGAGSRSAGPAGRPEVLLSTGHRISSFGEDEAGELYVVGHGGSVHKIVRPAGQG